jgi:Holliday junction DNA helicase RuvA
MDIIAQQDVNALKKVPGIGPKSAKRILMEMGEFEVEIANPVLNQAMVALENLGFNKNDVLKALSGLDGSVEEVIKQALKRLSR